MIVRTRSALRRAATIGVERPRAALWTTVALTCALLAVAIASVTALTVDRVVVADSPESGLVIYLGEGVTDERARALTADLRELPGVERIELVTAAESARRLVASLGSGAAMLEGVDVESLPGSVEVLLKPGVRDVIAMSPIIKELRAKPGVADVVIDDASSDQSTGRLLGSARGFAWIAVALMAGLAMVTALSLLRVRFDEPRRGHHAEYAVVELLGGGPSFVVIPTALAGAIQSLLAALLAVGLLAIGIRIYGDDLAIEIATPSALMIAAFVAGSTAIGLIAGGIAGVSRVRVAT